MLLRIIVSDGSVLELVDLRLQSGATLQRARLVYKTFGQRNARADNAVLVPTLFGGHHGSAPSTSNGVSV